MTLSQTRKEQIAMAILILFIGALLAILFIQLKISDEKFKTVEETINITVSERYISSFSLVDSFVVTEDNKMYYLEYGNRTSYFFNLTPHTEHAVRISKYISDEMKDKPATIIGVL